MTDNLKKSVFSKKSALTMSFDYIEGEMDISILKSTIISPAINPRFIAVAIYVL